MKARQKQTSRIGKESAVSTAPGAAPADAACETFTIELDEFRSVVLRVHTEQRYVSLDEPHRRPASAGELFLALALLSPSLHLEGGAA